MNCILYFYHKLKKETIFILPKYKIFYYELNTKKTLFKSALSSTFLFAVPKLLDIIQHVHHILARLRAVSGKDPVHYHVRVLPVNVHQQRQHLC